MGDRTVISIPSSSVTIMSTSNIPSQQRKAMFFHEAPTSSGSMEDYSSRSPSSPSSPISSCDSSISDFKNLGLSSPKSPPMNTSSPINSPYGSPESPSPISKRKRKSTSFFDPTAMSMTPLKRTKVWTPFNPIPDCPIFRPTEAEFEDPMKYIASIRDKVKGYGICKIVPPSKAWLQNRPFKKNLNANSFMFTTKMQNIDQLQNRGGPNKQFKEDLAAYLKMYGIELTNIPKIEGQELNLFKLYHAVTNRGGSRKVDASNSWSEIKKELKLREPCENIIREAYSRLLGQYEVEHMNATTKPKSDSTPSDSSDDEDFGYGEGRVFSLQGYHRMANNFKKKFFGMEEDLPSSEIENAYWRLVENSDEQIEVHYGSDLDVSSHGSGFPTDAKFLKTASGWNLNIFSKQPGSLFHHYDENIGGVTVPMMYIGMLFSSFCWHTEDNNLYSINYLHEGAPKSWYGIPAYAAEHFEKVMRASVPELFEAKPDLLFSLVTLLSPRKIAEEKVPIYHTIQRAGEFMITFPKAYHAGFSHGFNCAESSNFALDDWFPLGHESIERYRPFARASVLSIEKLICKCATGDPDEELTAKLRIELPNMKNREQILRENVRKLGIWKACTFETYEGQSDPEVHECAVCRYECYLSAVACPCSPEKVVCLRDAEKLCQCDSTKKTLLFRMRLADIDSMADHLPNSEAFQSWSKFYYAKVDSDSSHKLGSPKVRRLGRKAGVAKVTGVDYGKDEFHDLHIVDKVLDERMNNGKIQYLIHWRDRPESSSSWQFADEFACPGVIDTFRFLRDPTLSKRQAAAKIKTSSKMRSRMMGSK